MAKSRISQLMDGLATFFPTNEELGTFLAADDDTHGVIAAIPGVTVAPSEYRFHAARALEARGLLDATFFRRLVELRPKQTDKVAVLAAAYGASLGPLRPSSRVRCDVFLCHAGPDKPKARGLREALLAQNAALSVFLDEASIGAAADWPEEVGHALAEAAVVVVFVSVHLGAAVYARGEMLAAVERARQGRQQLVPLWLAPDVVDTVPSAHVLLTFNAVKWFEGNAAALAAGRILEVWGAART